MSSYFESLITTGSSALNDQEWQFSKEIGEVKTLSLSFFFFFFYWVTSALIVQEPR